MMFLSPAPALWDPSAHTGPAKQTCSTVAGSAASQNAGSALTQKALSHPQSVLQNGGCVIPGSEKCKHYFHTHG